MSFTPSPEVLARMEAVLGRYPDREAALLPILHIIQRDQGYVSPDAEKWAAARLGIHPVRVREVLSFYTLFRRTPAGKFVIQVCRNVSCSLAGSADLVEYLAARLGIRPGQTSTDGLFTLLTVECLGNCDHAPCLMINDEDHGPVTKERIDEILKGLA